MSTGILNLTNELREYLQEKGMHEHPALKELREETSNLPESVMQICPEQGALMAKTLAPPYNLVVVQLLFSLLLLLLLLLLYLQ